MSLYLYDGNGDISNLVSSGAPSWLVETPPLTIEGIPAITDIDRTPTVINVQVTDSGSNVLETNFKLRVVDGDKVLFLDDME